MVDVSGRILFSSPEYIVFALSPSLFPMCCEGTPFTCTLDPLLLYLYANINYSSIYLLYRTLLWRPQKFKILVIRYTGVDCTFLAFHVDTTIYWNSFLRFWHQKARFVGDTYTKFYLHLDLGRLCWFSLLPIPAGWPLSGPRSGPVPNQGLAIPSRVAMWVMSYKEKKKIWYATKNANLILRWGNMKKQQT